MRGYDLKFKVLSCKYSQLTNAVLPVISIFIHLYSHEKSLVSVFLRLKQEHLCGNSLFCLFHFIIYDFYFACYYGNTVVDSCSDKLKREKNTNEISFRSFE